MKTNNLTIRFKNVKDNFYTSLSNSVRELISKADYKKALTKLWIKLFFFLSLFLGSVIILYTNPYGDNFLLLTLNYLGVGLTGILLAFNSAHDAAHKTFSRKKWKNDLIFHFTFNMQGVNARLWKIRHLKSHHLFANVDGCDADIDDNPFLRLSPSHEKKWWHSFQFIYAPLLYSFYTLHWILLKDIAYLRKKELANLKNLTYSNWVIVEFILWKLVYFSYILAIPYWILDISFIQLLSAFLIMHAVISVYFVFTLIISHLTDKTMFPITDSEGVLPYNYYRHQLAVSLDYNPTSNLASWLFGGFNSHSAHHLFPNLPHTLYVAITPLIKEKASHFNYPYNELPIFQAIKSHFRYLWILSK